MQFRRRTFGHRTLSLAAVLLVSTAGGWVGAQGPPGVSPAGQAVYDEYCLRCHGLQGDGDGPEARHLMVPPANFHTPQSRAKSELDLLTIISYGIAFSPMHAWQGQLTEEQILAVIDYIRTLAPYEPLLSQAGNG